MPPIYHIHASFQTVSKKQQEVFRCAKELIEYNHQQQRQQMAPVLASAALSTADELVKWASLHDQGIISNEEFEAKKRQLLGL
ncbi:MAG TPA: SHOCT domain-containing protein [Ktedonobacterales bacterium]|nr:SHOCT domain-containing protein [Ktedonobacterales bacterium]